MDTPPLPSPAPADPGNDKLLAILCHVAPFLGVPFLLPLIVYLVKRNESALVAAHAKEALNFHLSLLIYSLCSLPFVILCCFPVGMLLLAALALLSFICAIIATIRASEGGFYFYPVTIRLIT